MLKLKAKTNQCSLGLYFDEIMDYPDYTVGKHNLERLTDTVYIHRKMIYGMWTTIPMLRELKLISYPLVAYMDCPFRF